MDTNDSMFMAQLMATYKIEAEEHLTALSKGLLALENHKNDEEFNKQIDLIFREAHSLKGASRAVNLEVIQTLCQSFEDVLAGLKQKKIQVSPLLINICYATLDLITKLLVKNFILKDDDFQAIEERISELEALLKPENLETKVQLPIEIEHSPISTKNEPKIKEEPEIDTSKEESGMEKIVRIPAKKLDLLLQHVEELLSIKLSFSRQLVNIYSINNNFVEWKKERLQLTPHIEFIKNSIASHSDAKSETMRKFCEFLEWELEFWQDPFSIMDSLLMTAPQDNRTMNSMVDSLLEDIKRLLMQPINTLLDIFPRMVRDLSQDLEKNVALNISGADIEIDRRILEELKDPLIHLIRNAIDHGIEKPEERVKLNKTPVGNLSIVVSSISSNQVELIISDDGQGINLAEVRNSAVKQGIISREDAEGLDDMESLELIYQSGITTSLIITTLSGRGVGLSIVFEKITKLGGHLSVETHPQQGTKFKIILPITLTTFRGLSISIGDQEFIMPSQHIQSIIQIAYHDIKTIENRNTIVVEGQVISVVHLSEVLGISYDKQKKEDKFLVVIVKVADEAVGFVVNQVLNEQEVLVKDLGKLLARVKNIAGATVLEEGKIIPILNPFDLIKSATKTYKPFLEIKSETKTEHKQRSVILLAEDSITVRSLFKNVLESEGYIVKTAVDGAEALSILAYEKIDLLLSDIEMPNLDGFELTRKVREMESLKDLPIVIITSRGSKEDREHGIELGADAYLEKRNFAQKDFLEIIQQLL